MLFRRAMVPFVLVAACTSTPPASHLTGAEYCERLVAILQEGSARCCAPLPPAAALASVAGECMTGIAPLIDDPNTGFDSAGASTTLDSAEEAFRTCQLQDAVEIASPDLRAHFEGTLELGEVCVSSGGAITPASDLACRGGSCSRMVADTYVCAPLGVEGSACTGELECVSGLYCALDPAGGACHRLLPSGSACSGDAACVSRVCVASTCLDSDPQHPRLLCETPLPVIDRDLDMTLVGLVDSPTRDVGLRVLDAGGHAVLALSDRGLRAAWTMDHVPHALEENVAYTAQIWTTDRADPSGETRSWELPIAAGTGTVVLTVNVADPTMMLPVRMPRLDAVFDVQTFDFDSEIGHPFWVRVVTQATGRTRAQARLYAVPDVMFEMMIEEAVAPGERYEILFVVDANDDGTYEVPPTDHSWNVVATATAGDGLSLPIPWTGSWRDVHF